MFFIAYLIKNKSYFLIKSNRSGVRRYTENRANQDQFNKYVFIDDWKIVGYLGKESPLLQRREEFKLEEANCSRMEENWLIRLSTHQLEEVITFLIPQEIPFLIWEWKQ